MMAKAGWSDDQEDAGGGMVLNEDSLRSTR